MSSVESGLGSGSGCSRTILKSKEETPNTAASDKLSRDIYDFMSSVNQACRDDPLKREPTADKLYRLYFTSESTIDTLKTTNRLVANLMDEAGQQCLAQPKEKAKFEWKSPELKRKKKTTESPSEQRIRELNLSVCSFMGAVRGEIIMWTSADPSKNSKLAEERREKLKNLKEFNDIYLEELRSVSEKIEKKLPDGVPKMDLNFTDQEHKIIKRMREDESLRADIVRLVDAPDQWIVFPTDANHLEHKTIKSMREDPFLKTNIERLVLHPNDWILVANNTGAF